MGSADSSATKILHRGRARSIPVSDREGEDFSLLADAAKVGRMAVDAAGTVTRWSDGAAQIFGWEEQAVLGRPFSLISPEDPAIPKDGKISRREISGRHRDGSVLDLELWAMPLSRPEQGCLLLLTDITEKKFLEKALLEATEREQRRIGQELHDHLCQHLLGAAFATKALAGALDRETSTHASALHDLARLINDSVQQARDISRGLNPVELDSAGLMSALQELANRAKHSIPCVFQCKGTVLVENLEVALNAYRIAQEAVTHALQNSEAKNISITLASSGDSVSLGITDDAKKESELTAAPQSSAARTVQYRAQAMHGRLTMTYQPGQGNRVVCTFPKTS